MAGVPPAAIFAPAQSDPADGSGGCVDVPWTGGAEDHTGFWRQVGRHIGQKRPLLTSAKHLAGGVPARFSHARQQFKHGGNGTWRHGDAIGIPSAEHARHDTHRLRAAAVGEDAARRCGLQPPGPLADQQGSNVTGIWRPPWRYLKQQVLSLLGHRSSQRVHEGLLYWFAQPSVAIEGGEGAGGDMGAGRLAATAPVCEHHARAKLRCPDACYVPQAEVFHRDFDR